MKASIAIMCFVLSLIGIFSLTGCAGEENLDDLDFEIDTMDSTDPVYIYSDTPDDTAADIDDSDGDRIPDESDICPGDPQNNCQANHPTERRKREFRDMVIQNNPNGIYPMPILAHEGLEIKTADIDEAIYKLLNEETGDFRMAQLVRVLYLTDKYDDQILPHLENVDYWLTVGEDQYCYWSENHMILWTSSAYLMKQREGWEMDDAMESRLRHYLDLKKTYGFYEFFSTTYLPFSLAALLNLADFAKDEDIKRGATEAAEILMKNWLLVSNDKGAFYPAAGRNYFQHYTSFHPHSIMWISTGLGPRLTGTDYVGAFLSTSTIDLRNVAASWTPSINTTHFFGHEQANKLAVHAGQTRDDRTIFQWSSGGYFHPDVANDTTWLVDKYDLENNHHFKVFQEIPNFPDNWSNGFAKIGAVFSRSSNISRANIKVYKNKGVVLTSIDNFYGGYRGYQQWPWAATVDDIAVWTQSGNLAPDFRPESDLSANTHLPAVFQDGHVAMIVFRPKIEIVTAQLAGKYNTSVSLYWPTERFDETREWDRWIMGRKGKSYIAVWRYGGSEMNNGHYYSNANRGRQLYFAIVGNNDTHGSFDNFVDVVKSADIKESFRFDFSKMRRVYSTGIDLDGKHISASL